MSDETKDKTANEAVAENPAVVTESTAPNAEPIEEATQATASGNAPAKKTGKGKKRPVTENVAKAVTAIAKTAQAAEEATKSAQELNTSALQVLGKAACKRHGLPAVWITADGQCFPQENDARNHGKSLGLSAEPIKVEA